MNVSDGPPPSVIGLDLSSTCTGMCLIDGSTDHHSPKGELLDRAIAMTTWARDYILPSGAYLVVIEAIGTNRVNTAIALAYVHAFVDRMLQQNNIPVVKVAPNVLKKWATGKGNADKHAMTVAAIRNGWNSEDSTDDEADAWWLWTIGRSLVGQPVVGDFAWRADILDRLDWEGVAA